MIERSLARLAPAFPGVEMLGVITDFTLGLDLRSDLAELPTTFFYPGSSIGNFTPDDALVFLKAIRRHCEVPGSGLLIGVDTIKDKARLEAAYDDSLGVTAAFNRNALNHVNRVLGSDFAASAYAHRAFYNMEAGRIEMHLEATSTQVVTLDEAPRIFGAGERIHTENSYKYEREAFAARLEQAGFARCVAGRMRAAISPYSTPYERRGSAQVARETYPGKLPSRLGRKKIAVGCANMRARSGAGSAT